MNTYTFSISTTRPDIDETYDTIHLFDQTNFTIDMSDVYATILLLTGEMAHQYRNRILKYLEIIKPNLYTRKY